MIRAFICIVICVFTSGTAYGQFPTYPFNRIDLGTQTDNNKYLIWVDDSAPTYTPTADTNAYVAIDTLAGVWYYYAAGQWNSISGGVGTDLSVSNDTLRSSTGSDVSIDTINYWKKDTATSEYTLNRVTIPDTSSNFGIRIDAGISATSENGDWFVQGTNALDLVVLSLKNVSESPVLSMYDANAINKEVEISAAGPSYLTAGNVGIGTSDPGELLHVDGGNIRMSDGSESAGSVVISDANGTMSHTTTPESSAAFSGWDTDAAGDTLSFSNPNLNFGGGGAVDISEVNYWDISGSTVYRSSGNVGINTSTPGALFGFQSTGASTKIFRINNSLGSEVVKIIEDPGNNAQFSFYDASGNENIVLSANGSSWAAGGSFGVGRKLPQETLHISAGVPRLRIDDASNNAQTRIDFNQGNFLIDLDKTNILGNPLYLIRDAGSEIFRIQAGRVGIGGISPAEKLHISGGSIRMADGTEGAGSVVISDANGTMSHTTTPESSAAFSGWDTDVGDDVNNITVGDGLDVSGTTTKDIDLNFGELETVTTVNGNDEFVMRTRFNAAGSSVATNAQVNVQDLLLNTLTGGTDISVSASGTDQIDIDYTGTAGDITAVNAGDHLTGGGTSGSVTLNVDEGDVWEALVSSSEFSSASDQSFAFVGNDFRILRWTVSGSSTYTIDIPDPDNAPDGAMIEIAVDNTSGVTFDAGAAPDIYQYTNGSSLIETDDVTLGVGFYQFVLMPDPNSSGFVWAVHEK